MPARRINEIVHGQRRISAATALRLARYDLEVENDRLGAALDDIQSLSDRERPSSPGSMAR
jgi:hypothetical protein